MNSNPVVQRVRGQLCNGLIDLGRLYIRASPGSPVNAGCVTAWPVIHRDGVQAVQLRNGQIDPGW